MGGLTLSEGKVGESWRRGEEELWLLCKMNKNKYKIIILTRNDKLDVFLLILNVRQLKSTSVEPHRRESGNCTWTHWHREPVPK